MATRDALTTYEYEIRKFKSFRGMEGLGFNLDLYQDGRLVARIDDAGDGGEFRYHFSSKASENSLSASAAQAKRTDPEHFRIGPFNDGLPVTRPDGTPVEDDGRSSMDRDLFIGMLVDAHELRKRLARLCKKQTVVQIGSAIGSERYSIYKVSFSATIKPRLAAEIAQKHPGQPVRWLNEEVAA